MRRYHLFEFLDQPWLPGRLRAAATAYLVVAHRTLPFPAIWAEKIAQVLRQCGTNRIVDLGSGSGGPIELVMRQMAKDGIRPSVILTDLHPAPNVSPYDYWPESVDAARVPPALRGVRTIFTTFHHFAPETAQMVLRDAFAERQPIVVFEVTARTPAAIAAIFVVPILVLLTPAIRPVSAFQIFFTYLVPVLPLMILWDALVSQLRTYSLDELRELTAGCRSPEYVWEFGQIRARGIPFPTAYLLGFPAPGIAG